MTRVVLAGDGALLGGLVGRGWDAHLLTRPAGAAPEVDDAVARVRIHPPPAAQRGGRRPGLAGGVLRSLAAHPAKVARELRRAPDGLLRYQRAVLLALDPELVHFGSLDLAGRFSGTLAALRTPARVVVTLSDDEEDTLLRERGLASLVLRAADGVLVGTALTAELLARLDLPLRPAVAVVPPRAARLGGAQEERAAGEPLRLLGMGPLSWVEGWEHALHAVSLLAATGVSLRYRIAGSGDFDDAIGFAVEQLGIGHVVEVVPPGRADEHLAWADVFVSAAVAARSPRTLLAAHAAGLPVVATDPIAGYEDATLVVPRRDPVALAAALGRLAADPALRRFLGEAGHGVAGATHDPEAPLETTIRLYETVLQRGAEHDLGGELVDRP